MRFNYSQFLWVIILFSALFYSFEIENSYEIGPKASTNKAIKSLLKKMIYLEGGAFNMGLTSGNERIMTASDSTLFSNRIPKRVSVESYFMSATEITNSEWREFYQDKVNEVGEERGKRAYYPDTSLWIKEYPYSYNQPMAISYFSDPKFDNYPVVGITWDQANKYCEWKSQKVNALLKKKGIQGSIEFRLPTEAEWEYAVLKRDMKHKESKYRKNQYYPWSNEYGIVQINDLANIGQIRDINDVVLKQYDEDGCLYTCKVASYPPTDSGIFDMGGNVSEWTSDGGYTISYDYKNQEKVIFKRLESYSEIEKEIKLLQAQLDAGNEDAKSFLNRLTHDKIVLAGNNIKICKGGNWAKGMAYAQNGSRQGVNKDKSSTMIGFRIVASNVNAEIIKYFPKKNWNP